MKYRIHKSPNGRWILETIDEEGGVVEGVAWEDAFEDVVVDMDFAGQVQQ